MKRKNTINGPAIVIRSKDPSCVNNLLNNFNKAFLSINISFIQYIYLCSVLFSLLNWSLFVSMFIFLFKLICFYFYFSFLLYYLNLTAACQTKARRKKRKGIIGSNLNQFNYSFILRMMYHFILSQVITFEFNTYFLIYFLCSHFYIYVGFLYSF